MREIKITSVLCSFIFASSNSLNNVHIRSASHRFNSLYKAKKSRKTDHAYENYNMFNILSVLYILGCPSTCTL